MIYFRKDRNVYVVSVTNPSGRVRRQAKTKEEAQQIERDLGSPKQDKTDFVFACREYQRIKSKRKVTEKTEKHWFHLLDIFLDEAGIVYLDDIKPRHLEDLQNWLMQDHEFYSEHVKRHLALKPQSVNRLFSTYRNFFRWCSDNEMMAKDVCRPVKQLKFKQAERPLVTDHELNRIFELCPDWFYPCLKFIHLTGMAPSSIEELKWKHIQFEENRIVYWRHKGSAKELEQKYFPLILSELVSLLEQHKARLIAKGAFLSPESFVFTNKNLSPIKAERISKVANKLFDDAGVNSATLYSIRHKLVDDLLHAGVGIEQAAQLVGHLDPRTTKKYTHQISMTVLNKHLETVRGSDVLAGADSARKKEGVS
jgi:site-specific recombinase XerD